MDGVEIMKVLNEKKENDTLYIMSKILIDYLRERMVPEFIGTKDYIKDPTYLSKEKKDKVVNIFDKKITLTNDERIFINFYLNFLSGIKECVNDMRELDYYMPAGRRAIDGKRALNRGIYFITEIMQYFIDYTEYNEDMQVKIQTINTLLTEEVHKTVENANKSDRYYCDLVENATDDMKSSVNSINAKAIGSEAGILCASDSLFMASMGTFATRSILEHDSNAVISNFRLSLDDYAQEH